MSIPYMPSNFPNGLNASNSDGTGILIGDAASFSSISTTATGISSVAKLASVSLTSAQILALRATSIPIVAAPGAGLIILPTACIFQYTYGTAAYTVVNVTLNLLMNGIVMGSNIAGTAFLNAANSIIYTMPTPDVVVATNPATLINKALVISNTGAAEALLGDGTLKITVLYNIFTT